MAVFNEEAEQFLLGCILFDGDLIKETHLLPEHFHRSSHRKLFELMKKMDKENEMIDLTTVFSRISDQFEEYGGVSYLTDMANSIASPEPFPQFEKHVIDAWKLRKAAWIGNKLIQDVAYKNTNIIHEAIQSLTRLEEVGHEEDFDLTRLLMEIQEDLEQDVGELTGIDTGFEDLNLLTNGWQDDDLIIMAARPSVGKTALALNMANCSANSGVITSFFSLEMRNKLLMKRMLSSVGNIDATKIRNAKLMFDPQDWSKMTKSMGIVSKYSIHLFDHPNVMVQDIRAKVRKLKRRFPDHKHICYIDYLTLIRGQGDNRNQEVGEITRQLKIMAREFNIPVVVLAQLSRSVESRQNKRPMMSDLRDSGEIEQHADVVVFLYRDDYYDQESQEKNILEVILAKQRNGPTGTVKLAFLKEYNKFVGLDNGR